MKRTIEISVPDDVYSRLEKRAADAGLELEEWAAHCLVAAVPIVDWKGKAMLLTFGRCKATPGAQIPAQTLYQNWLDEAGAQAAGEFRAALDQLYDNGMATALGSGAGLTSAGYKAMQSA